MPTTPRTLLKALLEEHGPLVRDAFLKAVAETVNGVSVKALTEALKQADYDKALDIIGISDDAFAGVSERVRETYLASGRSVSGWIDSQSSAELKLIFKAGDPVAADWLRKKSSRLVSQISEGQRTGLRDIMGNGMEAGRNPRSVALDVIGRRPVGANSRQGGILGLTRKQGLKVQSLREDLLSGDPVRLRAYMRLDLRDRRFDKTILRAISEKRGLTRAEVDNITGRYADRALRWRGENIARTEANQAFHAAQDHAFEQAIGSGHAQNVMKTWRSAADDRVRYSHQVLDGMEVRMEEFFVSPIGSMMRHPGDTSLGAAPEDIIQCRCTMTYSMVK